MPQMKSYLHEIYVLLGEDRVRLPWTVLLFLALSLLDLASLGLITPYVSLILDPGSLGGVLAKVVDAAGLPGQQDALLVILGAVLVGLFLMKAVASMWINRNIIRFGYNQQTRLRSILMRAYQNMPYEDYLRRNSSEYIHGLQQLTGQYAHGVILPLLRMLSNGLVAMVIIGFLAWSNILALSIMLGLFGMVAVAYDRLYSREQDALGRQANEAARKIIKGVQEGIQGFKEIRILGKENHFHDLVNQGAEECAASAVRSQVISTAPRYLLELLLISFIVLLVTITLALHGDLRGLAPLLVLFGVAALRLLPMINLFSGGIMQLRFNREAVSRLYNDLRRLQHAPPAHTQKNRKQGEDQFRSLSLKHVGFRYPGTSAPVLDDISLDIRAGEAIGLIGASGAGKTTLLDLLLGLLTPQEGVIEYNGWPLSESLSDWRGQVAYLSQQGFLVDDSLKANVALGVEPDRIDQEQLHAALRQARLLDLIENMPQGVDTVIGERGIRLSGGQRQRLSLARAFYHQRQVLIMDEATNALDVETEKEIVDEIQHLKGAKTLIIVAHRWTTVQHCDHVYKLENGRLDALGPMGKMVRSHRAGGAVSGN